MLTRCPAWCDRILMSPAAKDLINDCTFSSFQYNTIGNDTCMGDHKVNSLYYSIQLLFLPSSSDNFVNFFAKINMFRYLFSAIIFKVSKIFCLGYRYIYTHIHTHKNNSFKIFYIKTFSYNKEHRIKIETKSLNDLFFLLLLHHLLLLKLFDESKTKIVFNCEKHTPSHKHTHTHNTPKQ